MCRMQKIKVEMWKMQSGSMKSGQNYWEVGLKCSLKRGNETYQGKENGKSHRKCFCLNLHFM